MAGMTAIHVIGSCFSDRLINATSYIGMLEVGLIPQLRDRGLMEAVCLLGWWSTAHFVFTVCDILNEQFLGSWIGCGSQTSSTPFSRPSCIPDLATLAKFLWGFIKLQVSVHQWWVSQSCAIGFHYYYATNTSAYVTQNMAAHQGAFGTQQFICRSTCCTVTVSKW
jgi:hypothetical protein